MTIRETPLFGRVDVEVKQGSTWVPLIQDATQLSITRGAGLDGVTTKTDVGLATFLLKDAQDPMNGGTLLPGQEIRVRAGQFHPAYTVNHPDETVYKSGFNTGADGWTGALWSETGGRPNNPGVVYNSQIDATPIEFRRTLTELEPGRTYTVSGFVSTPRSASTTVLVSRGVVGVMDTSYTAISPSAQWSWGSFSFTATDSTHVIRYRSYSTGIPNNSYLRLDDVEVVKNAWVESFPAMDTRQSIFTGRIADLSTVYPYDKSNGTSRAMTQVTVADAVKVHVNTTRYGVETGAGVGFETFESRINRLSSSAQAPIEVPVIGAPREVYAF